jgi:hypothetical protein
MAIAVVWRCWLRLFLLLAAVVPSYVDHEVDFDLGIGSGLGVEILLFMSADTDRRKGSMEG